MCITIYRFFVYFYFSLCCLYICVYSFSNNFNFINFISFHLFMCFSLYWCYCVSFGLSFLIFLCEY